MTTHPGCIAVVCDEFTDSATVNMLNEVTRQLQARGQSALLINAASEAHFRLALRPLAHLPLNGLVFLASLFPHELEVVAEMLPAVNSVHLCHSASPAASVVTADGWQAGQQLALLLLAQGHQRFGLMQPRESDAADPRYAGYLAGLQQQGKTLQAQLSAPGPQREQGYQAMMAYLRKTRAAERINALFCTCDSLAFGALQAVRDFGQGAHVAVVGMDDADEARAPTWHLTTWAPRRDLLVREAISRLLDQQHNHSSAWQQGELQVRHSHLAKSVPGEMSQCGCAIRH